MLHQASNRFNPDDLWQKDRDHFLHPYTHFDSFKEEGSLVLVEGEGCYVKDAEGRRYLDGIGGMWCVNAGYGRREIAETMAEQALQLCYTTTFVDVTNAPAAELAAKLASLAPKGLNHVAFATSGSCGIDTAIRLAHYYQSRRGETERKYIISRKNSYHGSTYLGMTVGLRDGDQSPHFRYVPDLVHHLSAPYPYRRPDGMSLTVSAQRGSTEFGIASTASAVLDSRRASIAASTSSVSFSPPGAKILTPLSVQGLCEAVTTAAGADVRCDQNAIAGVGSTPRSSISASTPAVKAPASCGPDARVSRPTIHRSDCSTCEAARPSDRLPAC